VNCSHFCNSYPLILFAEWHDQHKRQYPPANDANLCIGLKAKLVLVIHTRRIVTQNVTLHQRECNALKLKLAKQMYMFIIQCFFPIYSTNTFETKNTILIPKISYAGLNPDTRTQNLKNIYQSAYGLSAGY